MKKQFTREGAGKERKIQVRQDKVGESEEQTTRKGEKERDRG